MLSSARSRRFAVPLLVAAVVLVADQLTKLLVVRWLGPERSEHRVELLGSLFAVEYVENTGAAFGTFPGQGGVLGLLALVVLGGLLVYYGRATNANRWMATSVGLLLGGALGNLLDRARLGYVVDFVAVGVWPKFNVADSAITVGVVLFAWHVLTSDQSLAVSGQGKTLESGGKVQRPADQKLIAER